MRPQRCRRPTSIRYASQVAASALPRSNAHHGAMIEMGGWLVWTIKDGCTRGCSNSAKEAPPAKVCSLFSLSIKKAPPAVASHPICPTPSSVTTGGLKRTDSEANWLFKGRAASKARMVVLFAQAAVETTWLALACGQVEGDVETQRAQRMACIRWSAGTKRGKRPEACLGKAQRLAEGHCFAYCFAEKQYAIQRPLICASKVVERKALRALDRCLWRPHCSKYCFATKQYAIQSASYEEWHCGRRT